MEKKKKIIYLEILRIAATCTVMLVHICNSARLLNENASVMNKTICTIVYNLFCISVPIFVMITGTLLLNPEKEVPLEKLVKKYMFRMILVLLTFGTGYAWLELIFDDKTVRPLQIITALSNMIQGQTWAHMWYIYMLVGLYAVTPIFRAFIKHGNRSEIKFFIIIMFVFICIPHIIKGFTGYEIGFYTPITYVYPLYYILGYYYGNMKEKSPGDKYVYAAGIISAVILIISGVIENYCDLEVFNTAALFSSPFILFFGLSIFVAAKNNSNVFEKIYGRAAQSMARCSFGIYILHMFFINIVYKFLKINPLDYPVVISIPLVFVFIYVCSYIGTWILLKIPFVRKYIL